MWCVLVKGSFEIRDSGIFVVPVSEVGTIAGIILKRESLPVRT
jgi:hypothetical protein